MQKILSWFWVLSLAWLLNDLRAQEYTPVDNGSTVKFVIRNLGINTGGTLKGLRGNIRFNAADLAHASFAVTVDVATVDTDIRARDNHLRKEEYFHVAVFPRISFVSKEVVTGGKPGVYMLTGIIGIKGISKELSFPFTVTEKQEGLLFEGSFKLNRRDFKVGRGSLALADKLTVFLSVMAIKK